MTGSTGQWKCEVCNKIIHHKKSLAQHKKSHSSIIKFSCSKCEKHFDRKENLARHQNICFVKKKKDSTCSVCLKEFTSQWFLQRH